MATPTPPGLVYTEDDIDAVVRTMLGEAANQGDEGLAAVAHVLVNRYERGGYGGSLYDVAHAPKQFSAWNDKAVGGNNLVNASAESKAYKKARAIAEEVLNGRRADNTGGAVNYFAPKGMTGKKGTRKGEPTWASQMSYTTTIGGHKFYSDDSAAGAAERMANGGDVRTYQQQLAQRGFDPGPIDGVRGPNTIAAVKAFQRANGLVEDGIVGPQTIGALNASTDQPVDLLDTLKARAAGVPLSAVGVRAPPGTYKPGDQMAPATDQELAGLAVDDRMMGMTAPAGGKADPIGEGPKSWFPEGTDLVDALKQRAEAKIAPVVPPSPNRGPELNPLPAPAPLVAPQTAVPPQTARTAPTPMQRPPSLSVAPAQVPMVAPVTPTGQDAQDAAAAPPEAAKMVRLPTGKMAQVGTFRNPETGNTITVVDTGNGQGKIEIQRKGFVDLGSEMNADTILGGIIRSKIAEAVPAGIESAASNFAPAAQAVQTAATQAIDTVAPAVEGLKTGVGDAFNNLMGMFGGGPRLQNAAAVMAPTLDETMGEQAQMRGRTTVAPTRPATVAPSPMPGRPQFGTQQPAVRAPVNAPANNNQPARDGAGTIVGSHTGTTYSVGDRVQNSRGEIVVITGQSPSGRILTQPA